MYRGFFARHIFLIQIEDTSKESENQTCVTRRTKEDNCFGRKAYHSQEFTDGFEFGFGAEIGISTQKLHARGPMGLLALTTTKYIIYGNGQVRP